MCLVDALSWVATLRNVDQILKRWKLNECARAIQNVWTQQATVARLVKRLIQAQVWFGAKLEQLSLTVGS